jgi:molybdopterin-guanine dinucleotide biosynthesis adapter protein
LISNLTEEGYNIGAIKHIHRENFTIDKEGTNTWRFSKAGSKVTIAFSPEEIATIKKKKTSNEDLEAIIEELKKEQLDIIFIEGFHGYISKKPDVLKIVTAKDSDDLKTTLSKTVAPILAITGIVAKNQHLAVGIPTVDLPKEGPQLLELLKKHLQPKITKASKKIR